MHLESTRASISSLFLGGIQDSYKEKESYLTRVQVGIWYTVVIRTSTLYRWASTGDTHRVRLRNFLRPYDLHR